MKQMYRSAERSHWKLYPFPLIHLRALSPGPGPESNTSLRLSVFNALLRNRRRVLGTPKHDGAESLGWLVGPLSPIDPTSGLFRL
ncbi:hypothetical protein Cob_v008334 [Colletotrichum orbiculare MAFF 240422]|uniref:Uncharacterized protein n=1 Tax=Colletotrichum orbiculare (strain 104-T / ATCC 96160 / CBS 514.97 / LARS 414 / MAFF 240422) TaxID=1213857 RepID=A0A484FMH6_COLOR|nr:hypothetical protein Cob_v008334 [Colletotrichum orbiculare MAFF 240422]